MITTKQPEIMTDDKLKDLTIEQLKKKDKFATLILIICGNILTICLVVMFFLQGMKGVYIGALFVTLLPIAIGRKRIREELKKRENAF